MNSPGTNREKVTLQHRSSLHNCRCCREEFQDVESICSGRLSHVPSQPAFIPSLGGMLSRDRSLRSDTWNLLGTSGNVFDSPRAVIDSSSALYQGVLPSLNQSATGGNPVRERKEKPFSGCEERNRKTIPTPRFTKRPSTLNSFVLAEGAYPQKYMADQSKQQISELQFDKFLTPTISCLKMKFKTQVSAWNSSLRSNVMDQRSGDGRFGGRF